MFRLLFIPLLKTVLVVALLVAGLVILIGRLGRRSEKKQLPPVSDDSGEVRKQEEDARKAVLLAEEERKKKEEKKKEEKKKQEEQTQDAAGDPRRAMEAMLMASLQERNALQCFDGYSKLFSRFAKPLQILMGLDAAMTAGTETEWLDLDMAMDTLQEDVAFEMRSSLRRAGGRIEDGKIVLPIPEAEDTAFFVERMQKMSDQELESQLHRLQAQIEDLQVYTRRKELVEALTGVYETLLELAGKSVYPKAQIHGVAEQAEQILCRNGIVAMYYEDSRLTSALAGRFGIVSDQQLVYPGLFLLEGEAYRHMAAHSGTRREI